jgi:DNA alkylation repair enzyme
MTKSEIESIVHAAVQELEGLRKGSVPAARIIRRRLSAQLRPIAGMPAPTAAEVVAIGLGIASTPSMQTLRTRWVGWELINQHRGALASLTLAQVRVLGRGNASWDEVDGYGVNIAGPAWMRGQISDAEVLRWAKHSNLWQRRAALVACVVLNTKSHGGCGDTARTLAVAELLIDDRADMIVKAMSWALRSLVPWDRAAVERFVAEHEARLAPRIKRETRTKLRTGHKNAPRSAAAP